MGMRMPRKILGVPGGLGTEVAVGEFQPLKELEPGHGTEGTQAAPALPLGASSVPAPGQASLTTFIL